MWSLGELVGDTDSMNSEGGRGPGGHMSMAESTEGAAAVADSAVVEGVADSPRAEEAAQPAVRTNPASTATARFI